MSAALDRRAALAGLAGAAAIAASPAEAAAQPDPLLELGRRWAEARRRADEASEIASRIHREVHARDGSRVHPFVRWGGEIYSDAQAIAEAFDATIGEFGEPARAMRDAVIAEQQRRAAAVEAAEAAAGLPEAWARCGALDKEVSAIEDEIMAATPASVAGVAVMLAVAMTWADTDDAIVVETLRRIIPKLPRDRLMRPTPLDQAGGAVLAAHLLIR